VTFALLRRRAACWGAGAGAAAEFAEADVAVGGVLDDAGADAVDAGERHAAEDALLAEEFGQAVFVAEAVLQK